MMDMILVLLALTGFVFLGSSRLQFGIRTLALQGILLGLIPLVSGSDTHMIRAVVVACFSIGIKGWVFPHYLTRAMRKAKVLREENPFVGFNISMLIGIVCLGIAFWVASRLPFGNTQSLLTVVVSFFNIFVGLFVIISRRKALTQVMGYLVLENGIYVFGVALALDMPLLVEMGVLLDIFVAVFVMGIMIFQISRSFDNIDTDKLSSLTE